MNDKIPKSKLPSSEDIKNAENARIEWVKCTSHLLTTSTFLFRKLQSAGLPLKLFHDLGPEQWTYYEWLIEMMSLNNDCPNYLKNYLRPVIRLDHSTDTLVQVEFLIDHIQIIQPVSRAFNFSFFCTWGFDARWSRIYIWQWSDVNKVMTSTSDAVQVSVRLSFRWNRHFGDLCNLILSWKSW